MIEKLYYLENLYNAFLTVRKASGWKETTQRYEEDLLFHLVDLRDRLINHTYVPSIPKTFLYHERGKLRMIESYTIDDRVVQSCFVNDIIVPLARKKVIYDNSASLKQRGTDHFRRRLEYHLNDFIKQYGDDGYLLKMDFTKYFDNIRHKELIDVFRYLGLDEECIEFTNLLLELHRIDVSYMNDEEYANCMDAPFNSIEYANIPVKLKTGKKFMEKSVGIGSQLAQVAGIIYPYRLDNYVKIVEGIKGYGRYMDDVGVIVHKKEDMKRIMANMLSICKDLGIFVNMHKTQIIPLRHRFTFLKTQYYIENGKKLVKIPDKGTFKREKRKLKKLKQRHTQHEITDQQVEQTYFSWRGTIQTNYGEIRSLRNIDQVYYHLFKEDGYE